MMRMSWTTASSPPSSTRVNQKVPDSSSNLTMEPVLHLQFLIDQCLLLVNGEQDVTVEDDEDEEELFELASTSNRETSDVCIEAEGDEDLSATWDSTEKNGASNVSEITADLHRAVIEDIRLTLINYLYLCSLYLFKSQASFS